MSLFYRTRGRQTLLEPPTRSNTCHAGLVPGACDADRSANVAKPPAADAPLHMDEARFWFLGLLLPWLFD